MFKRKDCRSIKKVMGIMIAGASLAAPFLLPDADAKVANVADAAASSSTNARLADASPGGSTPAASTPASASTPGSASTPASASTSSQLQGSVKAIDVEAAECLRQMGDCLKKIERAALELMGEATRQDYIAVGDPDVIGTMIIPAVPSTTGVMAVGPYLPVRKKMWNYYMNQIAELFPIYAEYVDSLVMPESVKAQATTMLEQMRTPFAEAKAHYMELLAMKKKLPKVDNKKVAVLSVKIHDDMDQMEKTRHDVFALLIESEKK